MRATRTDTGCWRTAMSVPGADGMISRWSAIPSNRCSSMLSNTGISVSAQRNRSIGSAPWSRCAFPNSQLPPRLQNDAMSSDSVMGGCSSAMFSTIKLGYRQGRAWSLTTYRHAATGCRTPGAAERGRAGTATPGCCRGSSSGEAEGGRRESEGRYVARKALPPTCSDGWLRGGTRAALRGSRRASPHFSHSRGCWLGPCRATSSPWRLSHLANTPGIGGGAKNCWHDNAQHCPGTSSRDSVRNAG
jgi:hypothetical protein